MFSHRGSLPHDVARDIHLRLEDRKGVGGCPMLTVRLIDGSDQLACSGSGRRGRGHDSAPIKRRAKELNRRRRDSGPVAIRGACNERPAMHASITTLSYLETLPAAAPAAPPALWSRLLDWLNPCCDEKPRGYLAEAVDIADLERRMRACDEPFRIVG